MVSISRVNLFRGLMVALMILCQSPWASASMSRPPDPGRFPPSLGLPSAPLTPLPDSPAPAELPAVPAAPVLPAAPLAPAPMPTRQVTITVNVISGNINLLNVNRDSVSVMSVDFRAPGDGLAEAFQSTFSANNRGSATVTFIVNVPVGQSTTIGASVAIHDPATDTLIMGFVPINVSANATTASGRLILLDRTPPLGTPALT